MGGSGSRCTDNWVGRVAVFAGQDLRDCQTRLVIVRTSKLLRPSDTKQLCHRSWKIEDELRKRAGLEGLVLLPVRKPDNVFNYI